MPEVIVIDEIGTEAEALAARTIAQRGVQLVATAHGALLLLALFPFFPFCPALLFLTSTFDALCAR
jgi:hypothetical protein